MSDTAEESASPPQDSESPPPESSTSPPESSASPPEPSTSPPPPPTSTDSSPSPSDPSFQPFDLLAQLDAVTAPPPKSESPPPTSSPPPSTSPPPPDADADPPPADAEPPKSAPPPASPPPSSPPPAPVAVSSPPAPTKAAPPPAPTKTAPPPSPTQTAPRPTPTQTPPPTNATPAPPPPPVQPLPTPPASVISPPVSLSPPPVAIPPPNLPNIPQTPPTPITTPTPSVPTPVPSTPSTSDDATPTATTSEVPPSPSSRRVPSSPTPPRNSGSEASSPEKGSSNAGTVVGVTVAGVAVLALVAIFFVFARRKKKRSGVIPAKYKPPPGSYPVNANASYYGQQAMGMSGPYGSQHSINGNNYGSQRGYYPGGPDSGVIGGAKTFFSYEEIMEMTNGFSRQNILGEGGFGYVYKGWLPDGKAVAVKQLKSGSGQGEREFRAEVEIISRVHHRHLVSLVGYSIAENQRLLLYEFLPNKTLEHHLYGQGLPVLEWSKRLKISLGSARGLAYLHEDYVQNNPLMIRLWSTMENINALYAEGNPRIIHRDIKSANILLDDDFEAQVADFGLAKPSNDMNTHISTRVMGTFGYMAPEYASSGKLTDRSDVFSFGVVLLELITGRKPVDTTQPLGDESLVEWARPLLIHALETGDVSELVDPRLERRYVESEMLRMIETAAACVRHSAPKRPRMAKVVRALDMESEITDLSNGVKYGQSAIYDSGQYNQELQRFRRMAFGDDSSDYDMYSGEYLSREISVGAPTSAIFTDSETRAMNDKL